MAQLIKDITIDSKRTSFVMNKTESTKRHGLNSIDHLIGLFKQYRDSFENNTSSTYKTGDMKYIPEALSAVEMWSLMDENDKNIFEGDYASFRKWYEKLDISNKKYYSERLVHSSSLIPTLDDEKYNSFQKQYNYDNLVVTIIGEFVCISNYDSDKISKLQRHIEKLGIVDSEIRIKEDIEGKVIYTLVYSSNQPPKS
jgi:hypothetical protein